MTGNSQLFTGEGLDLFVIIGTLVVLVSVIGGFLLEKGNLHVLFQPAELVIIFGSATGSLLIASPPRILFAIFRRLPRLVSYKGLTKDESLELLTVLFKLFQKMRKEGLIAIETEVNDPKNSPIFTSHPFVLNNQSLLNFICDTIKMTLTTNLPPHELDSLMEMEIEVLHKEAAVPSHSISRIADSLPGLGIVAAVLGVVLTMGKIDQPPAVLGHSIGAALVGTFLGVLACYGFVGPIGANLEHMARDEEVCLHVVRLSYVAYMDGSAPSMAVEIGRKAIPADARPTYEELEKRLKEVK